MPTTSAGAAGGLLQRVANRPIVCHVLDQLKRAGVDSATLIVPSWGLDDLRASIAGEGPADVDICFVPYGHERTLEDAVNAVAELVGERPCLLHVADGLPTQPLSELVQAQAEDERPDVVAYVHRSSGESTALGTHRLLRSVGYAVNGQALELAGVCMLGPGALRRAGAAQWWRDGRLDLAGISERLARGGANVAIRPIEGWLQCGGSTRQLLELNRFLLDLLPHQANGSVSFEDEANRIEGCVVVHPTARVESSTIVGPTVIGPNAQVVDAYIGPYTSIGAEVQVEGAEIERSIILPRAKITHIGGRLVGSVVGHDALVFRDFSLPRALRLNVGDGGEVALC
ncbi:MAG TPA: NDP-sugar synthase [Solirubrobacteraceae bacterium]|nr:NDP-sugar synthase [Solirubrobacteraceae bacterium]